MSDILTQLKSIGDELDKLGITGGSKTITSVMNSMFNIKTAQYVGVQGYWIRNKRCWDGCYRTKRTTYPDKPVQEIWQECHEEYVTALSGDDTSKWDKYAHDYPDIVKFASDIADTEPIARKASAIFASGKNRFNTIIKSKVAEGIPIENAVYETIAEELGKYSDQVIDEASRILELAGSIKKAGYIQLAQKIANLAVEMTKESQFMPEKRRWRDQLLDWATGVKHINAIISAIIMRANAIVNSYYQGWRQSQQDDTQIKEAAPPVPKTAQTAPQTVQPAPQTAPQTTQQPTSRHQTTLTLLNQFNQDIQSQLPILGKMYQKYQQAKPEIAQLIGNVHQQLNNFSTQHTQAQSQGYSGGISLESMIQMVSALTQNLNSIMGPLQAAEGEIPGAKGISKTPEESIGEEPESALKSQITVDNLSRIPVTSLDAGTLSQLPNETLIELKNILQQANKNLLETMKAKGIGQQRGPGGRFQSYAPTG